MIVTPIVVWWLDHCVGFRSNHHIHLRFLLRWLLFIFSDRCASHLLRRGSLLSSFSPIIVHSSTSSDLVCHRQIWFTSIFRLALGSVRLRDSVVCFLDANFSWMMVFEALVAVQIRFSYFWSDFIQSFFEYWLLLINFWSLNVWLIVWASSTTSVLWCWYSSNFAIEFFGSRFSQDLLICSVHTKCLMVSLFLFLVMD